MREICQGCYELDLEVKKLELQNSELREALAELVQALHGRDHEDRYAEEIADAEKLLERTNPEKPKCTCLCHSVNANSGGCLSCGKHETPYTGMGKRNLPTTAEVVHANCPCGCHRSTSECCGCPGTR